MLRSSHHQPFRRTTTTLAALATAAAVHAGDTLTLHVDDDAPSGGDGLSWTSPMRDLQDALAAAREAAHLNGTLKRIDILVAQGTYVPRQRSGDPYQIFVVNFDQVVGSVVSAASIQGGFAGVAAPNPALRDPHAFPTILSGDVNGDDEPYFNAHSDNTDGVVSAQGMNSTVVLTFDGLTIRGSNGAGIGANTCRTVVRDCIIEDNRNGGIAVVFTGGLRVESSVIRNNRADGGGGIFIDGVFGGEPFLEVVDSVIVNNEAVYGGGIFSNTFVSVEATDIAENRAVFGGGVYIDRLYNWGYAEPVIKRSRIVRNSAASAGGGICIQESLVCHSTLIANNYADIGGGLYAAFQSSPIIYSSTIAGNTARRGAGLMFDEAVDPIFVTGSIIWNNHSLGGGGEVLLRSLPASASPTISYSIVPAVETIVSPLPILTGSIDADPHFANPDGADNYADGWQDNDYSLLPASPAIDRGDDPLKQALDLVGNPRSVDAPHVPNRDDSTWPVDMGAIEFIPCPCDPDADGDATVFDLLLYLDWWFPRDALAERTSDHPAHIDVFDLLAFLDCWFAPASAPHCP